MLVVFGGSPTLRTIDRYCRDRVNDVVINYLFKMFAVVSIAKDDSCGTPLHLSCVDNDILHH